MVCFVMGFIQATRRLIRLFTEVVHPGQDEELYEYFCVTLYRDSDAGYVSNARPDTAYHRTAEVKSSTGSNKLNCHDMFNMGKNLNHS